MQWVDEWVLAGLQKSRSRQNEEGAEVKARGGQN